MPHRDLAGWTLGTYVAHNEALRLLEARLAEERDRRYAEVQIEREKAIAIKEKKDDAALELAREIQTYKDEKANELREQINRERGLYATKNDLNAAVDKIGETMKPLLESAAVSRGRGAGVTSAREILAWAALMIMSLITIGTFVFKTGNQPIYVPSPPGTLLPAVPPQPTPR